MKLTIIGDVHGKVEQYKQITDNCEFSICVGDFGFKKEWEWLKQSSVDFLFHKINMGNHDDTTYLNTHHSMGDFHWYEDVSLFTVRGAESIDKHLRIEGLDWFANEELNYGEQLEAFDFYSKVKPKIVISHDCPQDVMKHFFGYSEKSQTRQLLQAMFDEHQPDIWVFGHHHKSKDEVINGTRFVCLAELETLTIDV